MAESTTQRLGLTKQNAGTDGWPGRAGWMAMLDKLESQTAVDVQVANLAARPAPGIRGRYCWVAANKSLWRDTGTEWISVSGSWQAFTPLLAAANSPTVRFARMRLSQGSCRVQMLVSNWTTLTFTPAFKSPVPAAAHYRIAPVAPGELGRLFPGTFMWAGVLDTPNGSNGCILQDYDLDPATAGLEEYICGSLSAGGQFIGGNESANPNQIFFDVEYETT